MRAARRAGCALAFVLAFAVLPGTAWAGGGHGGHGHGHGHGHHGGGSRYVFSFGPWWGWPGAWGYGPRYYYPYAYGYGYGYPVYPAPVYAPPRLVVQEPPVYIERDAVPAAPAAPAWWYYCESAGAYYPDVESCAEPWVKVPPRAN